MARGDEAAVPLSDLLEELRTEIETSQGRLAESGQPAMFDVEEVTLEIAISATRKSATKGGVNIGVLGWLGLQGGRNVQSALSSANRLKLVLKPARLDGADGTRMERGRKRVPGVARKRVPARVGRGGARASR